MGHSPGRLPKLPRISCWTHAPTIMLTLTALFVISICALIMFAIPAYAQSIPQNASAKSYGDGWECNIGYRLSGNGCAKVIVPENAYETNRKYGAGWDCLHGFLRSDQTACIAVVVPDGGFLDPSGERWHCLRGHLKVDDTCQEIVLPANAYLAESTYGSTWECERGFEAKGDLCVAIAVPANAYLNTSRFGNPWTCDRGFFAQDGRCESVLIPTYAYFDDSTYGKGWKCSRGYVATGNRCEIIDIPANAHLDRSGNRWDCNRNFQKSKGQCLLKN